MYKRRFKRITIQQLANYFDVSRPTIYVWMRKYSIVNKEKYDPKDIQSVLSFADYLHKHFYQDIPALRGY
jgi:hypothetical protein